MATASRLLSAAAPYLSRQLGFPIGPVLEAGTGLWIEARLGEGNHPLFGLRCASQVIISVESRWLARITEVAAETHPDLLFSVFGSYELSRVTLPDGVSVWGPVPNYLADRECWRPVSTRNVVRLSRSELEKVEWNVFWHCPRHEPGFGVYEDGRLVALATVDDHGDGIMEIGVDVARSAQARGLGRAVVSAAGNWILEQGGTIHATAAFWNVPSTRTLRSLGLEYMFSVMRGAREPFHVPPQPLGKPLPDVEIFDRYPQWAMNPEIRPGPQC